MLENEGKLLRLPINPESARERLVREMRDAREFADAGLVELLSPDFFPNLSDFAPNRLRFFLLEARLNHLLILQKLDRAMLISHEEVLKTRRDYQIGEVETMSPWFLDDEADRSIVYTAIEAGMGNEALKVTNLLLRQELVEKFSAARRAVSELGFNFNEQETLTKGLDLTIEILKQELKESLAGFGLPQVPEI